MDKDFLIRLTVALYKVTDRFPEEEPLKFSMREKANEVLADFILISHGSDYVIGERRAEIIEQVLKNIDILKGYFEIAGRQAWVNLKNFQILEAEYGRIEEEVERNEHIEIIPKKKGKQKEQEETEDSAKSSLDNIKSKRSKAILRVLKDKGEAQIGDFKKNFPRVTKRTLRRDIENLLQAGFVERVGDNSGTSYKLART